MAPQGRVHLAAPAVARGETLAIRRDAAMIPLSLNFKLGFNSGPLKARAVLLRTDEGDRSVRVILYPDNTLHLLIGQYTPPESQGSIALDGGVCLPGRTHVVEFHSDRGDALSFSLDGKVVSEFTYHHLDYRVGVLRVSAPPGGSITFFDLAYAPARTRLFWSLVSWCMTPLLLFLLTAAFAALALAFGCDRLCHAALVAGLGALLFGAATRFDFSLTPGKGYYGDLAQSFAHGTVAMPRAVPEELLHVANTYWYGYAWKYSIWDYSMYKGKFFLYFGPVPALARLLFANLISEHFALWCYGFLWAAFFWVSAHKMRELYFADTPQWLDIAVGVVGALSPLTVYLLNIPSVYNEAVLAGAAFCAGGVYFALLAFAGERELYSFLAGLFFALGFASRVTTLFACVPFIPLLCWPKEGKLDYKKAALFLLPVFVCGVSLLIYNYVRFDNPFEFGVAYQYNATHQFVANGQFFSAAYIPAHIYEYFLRLPDFFAHFPFLRGSGPDGLVADSGVFTLFLWSPLALFAVFAFAAKQERARWFSLALLASVLGPLYVLCANKVVSVRYMADFANAFALAGAAGIFAVSQHRPKIARAMVIWAVASSGYIATGMIFTAVRLVSKSDYAALLRFLGII